VGDAHQGEQPVPIGINGSHDVAVDGHDRGGNALNQDTHGLRCCQTAEAGARILDTLGGYGTHDVCVQPRPPWSCQSTG
jgi:hypothetical protein